MKMMENRRHHILLRLSNTIRMTEVSVALCGVERAAAPEKMAPLQSASVRRWGAWRRLLLF